MQYYTFEFLQMHDGEIMVNVYQVICNFDERGRLTTDIRKNNYFSWKDHTIHSGSKMLINDARSLWRDLMNDGYELQK